MSLNHYKRSKIRSTQSSVFIDKEKFPEIIKRLKVYKSKNEKLKKAITIWAVVNQYGWMTTFDKKGNINKLIYRSDEWRLDSTTLLYVLGSYVEAGGYIKLSNEQNNTHWIYKFDGKRYKRQTLITHVVDFQDKDDLKKAFSEIVSNMMRLGFTKTEFISLIKKLFVQNILK